MRFFIAIKPTPKARPRVSNRGTITPKRTRNAQQAIALLASPYAPPEPFTGPVSASLEFVMPLPKTFDYDLPGSPHIFRPDWDNLTKLVLDALGKSGQWFGDDCQVWRFLHPCLKRYQRVGERVGIWLEITQGELK